MIPASAGLLLCGCLNFGEDVLTSEPTPEQVEYCRTTLHIAEGLEIEPLGLKILESGIDTAVWFVFRSPETDRALYFEPGVAPPDSLHERVTLPWDESMPQWWNTRDRTFVGWTVELPVAKWMTVGFQPTSDGTLCYVFWHET